MFSINNKKWNFFKLTNLFDIVGSKATPKKTLSFDERKSTISPYPYITRSAFNNGTLGYTYKYTEKGNVITIDSTVLGTAFYQPLNFVASDHIEKLIPKFTLNKYIALFIVTVLNKSAQILKYAYNNARSQKALQKEQILLPVDGNNKIDFNYMEKYMKKLEMKAKVICSVFWHINAKFNKSSFDKD